ncbi:MAG TPA: hypothetical protein VK212_05105 [Lentimicrobium sp.]|nr:hypothetical protein [Lentimicrobium sp.]
MPKRRKVRFRNVNFKFTVQQKRRVDAYCRRHGTTPVRLYKKAIMQFLSQNGYNEHYQSIAEQAVNQMSIFDLITEEVVGTE